jgi:hypothetical protein
VIEVTAFEIACQIWENEYIPVLRKWGFNVMEVPPNLQELPTYLLGERVWKIERGKKTNATVVMYAFSWEKKSIRINFAPVRVWEFCSPTVKAARRAFDEIVARLVVSATIQRHVRYKPHFIKRLDEREIQFQFVFKGNEWRWLAWVFENGKGGKEPYEVSGTTDADPIIAFRQFERAVGLDLLV